MAEGVSSVVAIAAGADTSIALTADGSVYTWGGGENTATKVLDNATQVDAKGEQFTAVSVDGSAYAWNKNETPTKVDGLSNVITSAAGGNHAMAVLSDGDVYTWGENSNYQLGDGTNNYSESPIKVNKAPEGIRVTKAVVGTVSYTDDAKLLYEFNIESGDELGIDGVKKFVPYRFNVLGTKRWENVMNYRLEALDSNVAVVNGKTISTVSGRYGTTYIKIIELNDDGTDGENVGFIKVNVIPNGAFTAPMVAAGTDFVITLKDDGTVWSWGSNLHNKVSVKSDEYVDVATQVELSENTALTNVRRLPPVKVTLLHLLQTVRFTHGRR